MTSIIKKYSKSIGLIVGIFLIAGMLLSMSRRSSDPTEKNNLEVIPAKFENSGLNVDFSKTSVNINEILDGGPGKDGIPALVDPKFISHDEARTSNETQVIYVEKNGVERLYPYNILVWHEVVNDIVGGTPLIITFCPLCGSAIVYEATVNDQVLEFGVSGYLHESNMIMYSREDPETLWSQSLGRAIVGDRLGQELEHYPFELLTYGEAKSRYPIATVLSSETGYSRNYDGNQYAGYDETEELTFPVSNVDESFPAKELFYIVPLEGMSVAVRQNKDEGVYRVPDTNIDITFKDGNINAAWGEAELPGYYEMWFSWATHHQENGILLD